MQRGHGVGGGAQPEPMCEAVVIVAVWQGMEMLRRRLQVQKLKQQLSQVFHLVSVKMLQGS
jgi:hypothetical protein